MSEITELQSKNSADSAVSILARNPPLLSLDEGAESKGMLKVTEFADPMRSLAGANPSEVAVPDRLRGLYGEE